MQTIARTPKQIGDTIRRVRKLKALSQGELGLKSSLWQETISKIESGSDATKIGTICTLLAALDLELVIKPRSKGSADEIENIFS
jgi:HTH-type transcriptional regulator / antitoxin HipB